MAAKRFALVQGEDGEGLEPCVSMPDILRLHIGHSLKICQRGVHGFNRHEMVCAVLLLFESDHGRVRFVPVLQKQKNRRRRKLI